MRWRTKAAVVGIAGDLEHGAAMIHPRLGMAMRRAIKRGRVIIPGHAKVGPPGTAVDLLCEAVQQPWHLHHLAVSAAGDVGRLPEARAGELADELDPCR